jgi:hypothetical protein
MVHRDKLKMDFGQSGKGQCSVTALVINDLFGGEILKTLLPEGWHFYNRIDGKRFDFTDSQFDGPIEYMDLPSNRDEAMLDTSPQQYSVLKQNLLRHLREKVSSQGSESCRVNISMC